MNKSELKKEFQEKLLELRKIINSWDLIPCSPKDEFDFLNHKILSHLYKGADMEKITRVLDSELTIHYGLYPELDDIEKNATQIIDWWNLSNSMYRF